MDAVIRAVPDPPDGMVAGDTLIVSDTGFCAPAPTASARQNTPVKKNVAKERIKFSPLSLHRQTQAIGALALCPLRRLPAFRAGTSSSACRSPKESIGLPYEFNSNEVIFRLFNNIRLVRAAQLDSTFRQYDANRTTCRSGS